MDLICEQFFLNLLNVFLADMQISCRYLFLPKPNMQNSVYRKLELGTFPELTWFIFVLKIFEGLWCYKEMKVSKFEGDWNEFLRKICLHRQSQKNIWSKVKKSSKIG